MFRTKIFGSNVDRIIELRTRGDERTRLLESLENGTLNANAFNVSKADEEKLPFAFCRDIDGFEDADGCPDLDNDGDGFNDVDDKCPLKPEDGKGTEPDDGCPIR